VAGYDNDLIGDHPSMVELRALIEIGRAHV